MKTKIPAFTLARLAVLAALSLAALPLASATDYTWVAAGAGTWNTAATNWNDGVTNPTAWVNGAGNNATFNGFASNTTITVGANLVLGTLSTNATGGSGTIQFNNAFSMDVTTINTTTAAIDMFTRLTGSHDLTYNSTGGGRLNLKTAADYTGATTLTGSAYILSDSNNNVLPTATTLSLGTGTTYRLASSKSQQVGLLTGAGTVLSQGSGTNLNTFTINTANGASGTFTGTIRTNSASVDTLNLVISGLGTQTLSGTNSFKGATTVSGGTLILGSNLTASTSVTVNGGTLQSSVANVNLGVGAVTLGSGAITPGGIGSAGKFTVANNQSLTATGGTFNFDVGTSLDQIAGSGTGAFSLTDTTLALNLGSGFDYSLTYQLFSGFSSGSISSVTITGYDTVNWTASLGTTAGLDLGQLSFTATAVPEPSAYAAIAGLGALGWVALRRRTGRR